LNFIHDELLGLNVYVNCGIVLEMEIGMDIKKKRRIVIVAVSLPFILLGILGVRPGIPGGLMNIFCWIYTPCFYVKAFVRQFSESHILLYVVFWLTYIATYLLLGWIIARLIYPDKKISNKAEIP
jgi:predicted permease